MPAYKDAQKGTWYAAFYYPRLSEIALQGEAD